ncbi:MAG: tetratricopeptide repeat protein, partial [Chlorobi bacterium]|nr:tetratricopeptide repeat protein [Chlorobiota bacterium]
MGTLLLLSSCSMWQNFTVYFNRYYNAELAFEEAQEMMAKEKEGLFSFKEKKLSNNISQKLEAVIEKCSKIIQFDSESSFLPGALYLIGRSFYYQQHYPKALRKFQELYTQNDEEYELASMLWIGKTQLQLRSFDDGMSMLDTVKAKALEADDTDILTEAYRVQIAYMLYKEDFNSAENYINEMLTIVDDDELRAEVAYSLGKIYLELEKLDKAAEAFLSVENYSPSFETDFESRLEYARVKRMLGETDASLEILENMSAENKYEKYKDKIELEIANIYRDRGDIELAFNRYMDIDTTFTRTESSGLASYNLGLLLQEKYALYDSAMVFYNKALSAPIPVDIKKIARTRSNLIGKYIDITEQQYKEEKELTYILDPDLYVQDSLDYEFAMGNIDTTTVDSTMLADSLRADSVRTAAMIASGALDTTTVAARNRNRNNNSNNNPQNNLRIKKPIRPKIEADSAKTLLAKTYYELGNLFFGDLNVKDSSFYYYTKSLEIAPNSPTKPRVLFALGSYYFSINDSLKADSLFQLVYDDYPEDEIAIAAAKKLGRVAYQTAADPAEDIYLKAENYMDSQEYEKAISVLREIYSDYPKSPFAPKALFATGYIYENYLEIPDSAAAVYDSLSAKFKRSEYTLAISAKLLNYKQKQKAIQDSIAKAQAEADSLLAQKELPDSLKAKTGAQAIGDSSAISAPPADSLRKKPEDVNGRKTARFFGKDNAKNNSGKKKESQKPPYNKRNKKKPAEKPGAIPTTTGAAAAVKTAANKDGH